MKRLLPLSVVLLLIPFACTKKEISPKGINPELEDYRIVLSSSYRDLAVLFKAQNLTLRDAKGSYLAGLSFADNYQGQERENFINSYNQAYAQTLVRANNSFTRTRTTNSIDYQSADLTAYDIPEHAQAFIAGIASDAYTSTVDEIISRIETEISGPNAQFYTGENNAGLQLLISFQEAAIFLRDNPEIVGDLLDESGRVQCGGWFIAGSTVLGGVLGGAIGFIGGSFVLPGIGSVAGGVSGAEVGAALGGVIGGATLAVSSRVFCDQLLPPVQLTNGMYDPYNIIGHGNRIDGLSTSNLLIKKVAYKLPSNTTQITNHTIYNLF